MAPETDDDASARRASEDAIYRELLAARKRPGGLSPQSMAQCPVMSDLLGNGDPEVAHVQLCLKVLEITEADDDVTDLEAACYSLGLTTEADTHLARLQQFGDKYYIDQRQARRYSDRGIKQLARLIATHWTTQTVPEATVIVIGTGPSRVAYTVQTRCQLHVDMRPIKVGIWLASQDAPTPVDTTWRATGDDPWVEQEFGAPEMLLIDEETTIRIVWRGEVWPKFTVVFTGNLDASMARTETLGAACAVTLTPGE